MSVNHFILFFKDKKIKLLLFIILLFNLLFAQPVQNNKTSRSISETGVISGAVFNSDTGSPIEYASITLFKKELSPITTPIYSLSQGLALGGISYTYAQQFEGIVFNAVSLTAFILLS